MVQKFRAAVSQHRLEVYRQPGDTDFDVVALYVWNVLLCEALYPSLQSLEVTLRNGIHAAATARYHTEFWFDPPPKRLAGSELADVANAKAELMKMSKPMEAGRIVAELNFGFWTSLLNSRYEQVFWPWMLSAAFPGVPRPIRTRHTLSKRLNEVRHLRNRVFHHERISHLTNLRQRHTDSVEAVGWVSPESKKILLPADRFPTVYDAGPSALRRELGHVFYGDDYSI